VFTPLACKELLPVLHVHRCALVCTAKIHELLIRPTYETYILVMRLHFVAFLRGRPHRIRIQQSRNALFATHPDPHPDPSHPPPDVYAYSSSSSQAHYKLKVLRVDPEDHFMYIHGPSLFHASVCPDIPAFSSVFY
jgi:hypothetical protein